MEEKVIISFVDLEKMSSIEKNDWQQVIDETYSIVKLHDNNINDELLSIVLEVPGVYQVCLSLATKSIQYQMLLFLIALLLIVQ